ncbi:MAG: polysaccharide deacetylase family protein [Bariatricus massiliensis]|nr:polysaccharide deacetylase family protein [uncultured Bariatricus sp.]MDY2662164.1 polysaccharide deacetylase family protein [Bariatricus massiliensis]
MAQRRRKRIGGKIVVTVAVFILAGTAIFTGYRMLGKKSPKSDKKNTSSSDKKREIPAINTNVSVRDRIAEKEARKKQNNREDFAVQPGDVPGVQEQTQEKVVYLTLDDGPSPNTQAVLDILDKYQVKATFFVTNGMPEYSYMIKEAYDRGHTIGLHTYSHDYAVVYASQDAYFKDLEAIGEVVKGQIGYVPCFIRFPGGSSNTVSRKYTSGIMTALAQEVQNRGYQYYDWNASSGDGGVLSTEELVNNATSFNENNIILLSHDSAAKQTTVEALPRIIEHYQSLGYEFRALDRDTYVPHHGINN